MSFKNFDDLLNEALATPESRAAYHEQQYAVRLADQIEESRRQRGWSLRCLAQEMSTSLSQVQRVLAMHGSGTVKLRTIFRALEALDLELEPPVLSPRETARGAVPLWQTAELHVVSERGKEAAPAGPITWEWTSRALEAPADPTTATRVAA